MADQLFESDAFFVRKVGFERCSGIVARVREIIASDRAATPKSVGCWPKEGVSEVRAVGPNREIQISGVRGGEGWLTGTLQNSFNPRKMDVSAVRHRAQQTARLGKMPLWEGYRDVKDYPFSTTGARTSEQVRTAEDTGAFFAWLASQRKPDLIVEFGTAFGVSGMYWLTGLKLAGRGRLMTYEPNEVWAEIAEHNLQAISDRFTLTRGTFEDSAIKTLAANSVDIAFIDAIHTSGLVYAQYTTLQTYLKSNALVLFADINCSADMQRCWRDLAVRPEVLASFELGDRVGLIELSRSEQSADY